MRRVCLLGVVYLLVAVAISGVAEGQLKYDPATLEAIRNIPKAANDLALQQLEIERMRLQNEALQLAINAQRRELARKAAEAANVNTAPAPTPPSRDVQKSPEIQKPIRPDYSFGVLVSKCRALDMAMANGTMATMSWIDVGFCDGYASAMMHASEYLPGVCVGSGISVGDLEKAMMKYGDSHPERSGLDRDLQSVIALQEAFPCRKTP